MRLEKVIDVLDVAEIEVTLDSLVCVEYVFESLLTKGTYLA